jgi:hypothetical protein
MHIGALTLATFFFKNIFSQETSPLWSLLGNRIQEGEQTQSTKSRGESFYHPESTINRAIC